MDIECELISILILYHRVGWRIEGKEERKGLREEEGEGSRG